MLTEFLFQCQIRGEQYREDGRRKVVLPEEQKHLGGFLGSGPHEASLGSDGFAWAR